MDPRPRSDSSSSDMSNKLSPALKALLKAPHARGAALPAPSRPASDALFAALQASAAANGVGHQTWLTLSTAALVTLNSPATLCELYSYSTRPFAGKESAERIKESSDRAAIIREAGLKCISFSGIPRIINALGALRAHLEPEVASSLSTVATRLPTPSNVTEVIGHRALGLWNSIYDPHSTKLLLKLSDSHPDLPVHILSSHYGPLLADPSPIALEGAAKVGRVLTSVVAIASLRAQQGVTPQVISHVFGLKKSLEEGSGAEGEVEVEGQDFLVSDEGSLWVLAEVDRIVQCVAGGDSTFSGGLKRESKL